MRLAWRLLGIIGMAAVLAYSGCGKGQKPLASTSKSGIPLPEWAPRRPSPEFLRAAKVLKPTAPELLRDWSQEEPGAEALAARLRETWPAAYEFFGSLTNQQIEHFLSTKQIRIPVRSLSQKQRTALENWLEKWRKAMKGAFSDQTASRDVLVTLYKLGATEDLSNVDVGFSTAPAELPTSESFRSHHVNLSFWVKRSDGSISEIGMGFADM